MDRCSSLLIPHPLNSSTAEPVSHDALSISVNPFTTASKVEHQRRGEEEDDTENEKHRQLRNRLQKTQRELEELSQLMESERRILPLPRRRIASGSKLPSTASPPRQQPISPNLLFSRLTSLNDEVNAISLALTSTPIKPYDGPSREMLSSMLLTPNEQEPVLEDSEEEDDDCTGCRDWLENVKNKKKRKIPTSAVMGHPGNVAYPVYSSHPSLGPSPGRTSKQKTRRRRTWDVSSEARPDSTLRSSKSGAPVFHVSLLFIVHSCLSRS